MVILIVNDIFTGMDDFQTITVYIYKENRWDMKILVFWFHTASPVRKYTLYKILRDGR